MNNRQDNRQNAGRPLSPQQQRAARTRAEKQREAYIKQEEARKKQKKAAEKQRKQRIAKQKKEAEKQKKAAEKMRRHDERFELTEEERAIREQMRREEKEYRARQRARRTKVFFGRLFVFLLMFCTLLAVSVGLFYANLVRYEHNSRRNFTYVVGNSSTTVSYDKMVQHGTLFVNMTPIVEMCEMAVTGDTAELRYITRDAKEHVQFIVGSTQVFINGVEERLTAAPYLDGEDLYVPYDFFNSYVSGISVLYDSEKNTVTVEKTLVEETDDTYETLRFVIRSDEPLIGLNEYNEFGNTSPIDFVSDLSLYEDYMNPSDRDDYLILVNAEYPLPQSYVPETVEITDIRRDGRPLQYLCQIAEKAAHAMIMEL
ncbi:MAG: stalk domain-containing protein, partial [Eubacteriales bacterium]